MNIRLVRVYGDGSNARHLGTKENIMYEESSTYLNEDAVDRFRVAKMVAERVDESNTYVVILELDF